MKWQKTILPVDLPVDCLRSMCVWVCLRVEAGDTNEARRTKGRIKVSRCMTGIKSELYAVSQLSKVILGRIGIVE